MLDGITERRYSHASKTFPSREQAPPAVQWSPFKNWVRASFQRAKQVTTVYADARGFTHNRMMLEKRGYVHRLEERGISSVPAGSQPAEKPQQTLRAEEEL